MAKDRWRVAVNEDIVLATCQDKYSGEDITSVKTLGANISINKACNPINLGAKLKLLFSSLQNCPWM